MAGADAVIAAINGNTGKMVIFERVSDTPYSIATGLCDIEKIANKEKRVPDNLINSDGTGVTKEFDEYARPLIIGELYPFIVDGLPRHLRLHDIDSHDR